MKTVLWNFLSVLRRFKTAALLNVLGLSVAYVAFMMIMMQVNYDLSFDTFHPNANSIFRIDPKMGDNFIAVNSRPFARLFTESSPHIKSGCILFGMNENRFFSIEHNGQKTGYKEDIRTVSSSILDVFTFDMVEGNSQALEEPNSVILPESMAHKLFGNGSAIGKQLLTDKQGKSPLQVKGVYKDFPENTLLANVIYAVIDEKVDYNDRGAWNYEFFVRLDSPENKKDVLANFVENFDAKTYFANSMGLDTLVLQMTSLPEIHFLKNVEYDMVPKANRQTVFILCSIAIIILIIAGINFTNFSTALTPMRIKSINTQKVLGSSDKVLRTGLLVEAVSTSFIAYLISLWLLVMIGQTQIASLVDGNWSIGTHPFIIGGTALIAVAVGLLAGLYPSFYITSFPPALVLKGSFGLSLSGRRMRNVLVGIQYIASFILIISASFMFLQNYFVQHAPVGYDRDQMIVAELNTTINENSNAFVNQLKTFSGIEDVTFSQFAISSQDQYTNWARDYKDKQIRFECLPVSSSFLEVMGIQVREGRGFRPEDDLKDSGCFIFNEKARAEYGLELNEKLVDGEIIGFIPDIKFASLRQEVSPMAFYLCGKNQWEKAFWGYKGDGFYYNIAYIKVKAGTNLQAAMEHVNASLTKLDSEYPFTVRFYDEILQQTYEKEMKISMLITLFSLVAIFISIVGVFGLVVFESEYRRKEIAIRKVLGSTIREVLLMFNRGYLTILMICFVLGAPVAWYGVSRWLENFAYRTPMYWWVFPLAFLLVGMITAATVTYQNWCVASENPVENIKSE